MPWSKVTDHDDCDGIAVVKDSTGEVEGCHQTEEQADDQLAALNAAEDERDLDVDIEIAYPDRVQNAAQAALDAKGEYDSLSDCGTGVGEDRARAIVNEELVPDDFIGGGEHETAIPSYLSSHSDDLSADGAPTDWGEEEWTDGCGNVQYALWGYYQDWADAQEQKIRDQMDSDRTRMHGMPSEPFAVFGTATNTDAAGDEGYFYPLYLSEHKATSASFNGVTHLHTFEEFGQEMYMPDQPAVHAAEEPPSLPVYHDPSAMRDENENETRADVSDLESGALVTWGPSNATRYGEVAEVHMEGEVTSDSGAEDETTMEASEDNPVVEIDHMQWDEEEEEWMMSDTTTVHRPGSLEVIEDLPERSVQTEIRGAFGQNRAVVDSEIRMSSDGERTTIQFMTEDVARDGMVLDADGMDLSAYRENPVVLWQHGRDSRRGKQPIAKTVDIERNGDGYLATIEWYDDDFSQRIKDQVKRGYLNAASVGWRTEDIARGESPPRVSESDMTEFSIVSVPTDTGALVEERSTGSLADRLDEIENQLEELRAQATASSPPDATESAATGEGSAAEDRDAAQGDGQPGASGKYVRLSTLKKLMAESGQQWTREDIRTALKQELGMA